MKDSGGKIEVGDEYGSNFLAVYPMKQLTRPGKEFTVKMKIEESAGFNTYVYHSYDMTSWSRVADASFEEGIASFKASSGKNCIVPFLLEFCSYIFLIIQ